MAASIRLLENNVQTELDPYVASYLEDIKIIDSLKELNADLESKPQK